VEVVGKKISRSFCRMRNWRRMGMSVAVQLVLMAAMVCRAQQIAFTWDDVPAHGALPSGETRVAIAQKLVAAAIAQLESSYLEAAAGDAEFRRAMAKALFGRDIPYVLLMHVGAFDARMLPRLLALYKREGFSFVTLEEAEKDPFYTGSMNPAMDAPPDLLEVAMQAKGLPLPARAKVGVDVNSLCR
jgi:hypothetical protein